jgi:hypothetical protein
MKKGGQKSLDLMRFMLDSDGRIHNLAESGITPKAHLQKRPSVSSKIVIEIKEIIRKTRPV